MATSFFSLLSWVFCSSSSQTLERGRPLCVMALLSSSLSLIPACCVWMCCCHGRDLPWNNPGSYRKPDISAWLAVQTPFCVESALSAAERSGVKGGNYIFHLQLGQVDEKDKQHLFSRSSFLVWLCELVMDGELTRMHKRTTTKTHKAVVQT